jgi:Zn-dependent protease
MFNRDLAVIITSVVTLVIAFTIHEFAHAWVADSFGDSTPRINGRLTLNPLAHLDLMGSLMLIFAGFGWAKPVPVNPYTLRQRSPSALMWVALAGPLSNFLLAILASLIFKLSLFTGTETFAGPVWNILHTPVEFTLIFIYLNLVLGIFNLIPLTPLDGDKVAAYFLPDNWNRALDKIRPYGPMILVVLFMLGPTLGVDILGWLIYKPVDYLFALLIGL